MTLGADAQRGALAHGSGAVAQAGGAIARAVPYLGHGVGLRVPHYARALEGALDVDWVEVITENFFGGGGRPRAVLEAVRRERPLVFHGVSLGIGSLGPPDMDYLRQVKALADAFEPAWLSDHVCWTRQGGRYSHELLPLPFTPEALTTAVENTQRAQDYLRRALVLENVSSYVTYRHGDLTEWEFLGELSRRSGCSLLLDLNNILVSAYNHGFSANEYLSALPVGKVAQFHLANHSQYAGYKFDDHRGPVPAEVWTLFEAAVARFGDVSSLVEWDEDVPAWQVLVAERDKAAARASRVRAGVVRESGQASAQGRASDSAGGVRRQEVARVQQVASGGKRSERRPNGAGQDDSGLRGLRRGARPPTAPALERTQQLFMRALTWPRGARNFAEKASEELRRGLEQTFAGSSETGRRASGSRGLDAIERLDIYANAYFYRLLDALREMFPRLAYLTGDIPFHNLVTDYLLECPSTAPDLRRLGDRLPEFLRRHALGLGTAFLPEVAELEVALTWALDAPDALKGQLLTRAELAQRSPDTWPALTLALAPSARCLSASHDLERIARLCDTGQRDLALDITPSTEPVTILVGRRAHAAYFRGLDPNEAIALRSMNGASPFDTLCDALARRGAPPTRLVEYLIGWVDDGVIVEARSTPS